MNTFKVWKSNNTDFVEQLKYFRILLITLFSSFLNNFPVWWGIPNHLSNSSIYRIKLNWIIYTNKKLYLKFIIQLIFKTPSIGFSQSVPTDIKYAFWSIFFRWIWLKKSRKSHCLDNFVSDWCEMNIEDKIRGSTLFGQMGIWESKIPLKCDLSPYFRLLLRPCSTSLLINVIA